MAAEADNETRRQHLASISLRKGAIIQEEEDTIRHQMWELKDMKFLNKTDWSEKKSFFLIPNKVRQPCDWYNRNVLVIRRT